jgi:hypothetical protein
MNNTKKATISQTSFIELTFPRSRWWRCIFLKDSLGNDHYTVVSESKDLVTIVTVAVLTTVHPPADASTRSRGPPEGEKQDFGKLPSCFFSRDRPAALYWFPRPATLVKRAELPGPL